MPSKTEPKPKPLSVDPRSAKVILAYVGENDRSARNAPPRDLTENDVARLAFVEAHRAIAGDVGQPVDHEDPDGPTIARPDPRNPDPAVVDAIIADLVGSGYFKPKSKAVKETAERAPDQAPDEPVETPAETDSTTTQPDQPADEPEV